MYNTKVFNFNTFHVLKLHVLNTFHFGEKQIFLLR